MSHCHFYTSQPVKKIKVSYKMFSKNSPFHFKIVFQKLTSQNG
ncbi:hypothetical protein M153_25400011585 [Pseudoloma neurophilia]|uniref:Uncharacterized protein n=1 Tax=Pseudoloma neurophilia TaxID=146866 RepID=A0A0R0LYT4_9MICR|nr:hypothetical protein M153_25400011585 [Pseudoloma neurophilia]